MRKKVYMIVESLLCALTAGLLMAAADKPVHQLSALGIPEGADALERINREAEFLAHLAFHIRVHHQKHSLRFH